VYVYVYIDAKSGCGNGYVLMCLCVLVCSSVRDEYGCASGCTACDAHMRAMARGDNMGVAITCACAWVRPPVYIANALHTSCTIYMYVYIYRCKVRVCKWVRVCVLAYACDRVRALTLRLCAACVGVRRALFVTPSIDQTRTHTVYVYPMHACIYIHARLAKPMNGSPMPARCTHVLTCCVHARARVRVCQTWARTNPRRHMRAPCVGIDRAWLGSQAFMEASAFIANIGAWNTARVTDLSWVCAASPARAARHRRRDALGGVVDAARAVVRGSDR
jgi:hypothetical protein